MKVMSSSHKQQLQLMLAVLFLTTTSVVTGADRTMGRSSLDDSRPEIRGLKLDVPLHAETAQLKQSGPVIDSSLIGATGMQRVIVRLRAPATSQMKNISSSTQRDQKFMLESEQNAFVSRCTASEPSIRVIGRVQHVLNAVFMDVPASALTEIAADPQVERIAPVGHYEKDLSETVPYVGAGVLQAAGIDGKGIKVAVLDSGVDYTHADMGGSGDVNDFLNNDPNIIEPGTFPTAKVAGGYDFLGSQWPIGPGPLPDPDPLDDGPEGGHGTHVADIIAGINGVAPGAEIYAVKVCSSVANSCNGISLIMGMEFAVDPNGDGDTSDRMDIVNMSLGAGFGQAFDDDLSTAVDNATTFGVLTVASAGNCGDIPYCTGSPASAPTALSVAQTHVPSATAYLMNVLEPASNAGNYNAVKYAWTSAISELVSGLVQYGDIDGTNLNGCAPFTGDLSARIVAVDRGACSFSDKIRNIENAGGVFGIVMLVAPGAPFAGSFAGGAPINIPGVNISQVDGDILRAGDAVVQFGPQFSSPLVGSTVSSTARGPDISFSAIKPEIGAPGASLSAEYGTGTARTTFGGTSGAAPMVAGAAALLKQACNSGDNGKHYYRGQLDCSPLKLKTILMNNAYRDVISDTTGELAEITRIGGGELRVDESMVATFMAFSSDDDQPSLSLGFMDVDKPVLIKRIVVIRNLTGEGKRINVMPTFRFADDQTSEAIRVSVDQRRINLGPYKSKRLKVKFRIDPRKLSGNAMNSSSEANNPAALKASEFDGYLLLREVDGEEVALPWQVLPRKAANVVASRKVIEEGASDSISLINKGAGIAQNNAYSIIGLSDEMPRGERGMQTPTPDIRAVGVNTTPVESTVCTAGFLWSFAINTWDRQTQLAPVSHLIGLDIDQDGTDDYQLFNQGTTLNERTSDGRQITWVADVSAGTASAFFFTEHATNTGNTVLLACGEHVGLSTEDMMATNVNVSAVAQDFFNGGPGDSLTGMTITPLGERYLGLPSGDLPAGTAGTLEVFDFGLFPNNTPESGIMLFTNGDRGAGARGGATESTEALLLLAPDVDPPKPLP